MKVSFEGIGQVCATFLGSGIKAGQVVKMTAPGTVGVCADGNPFCGVALIAKDGGCSVLVRGFVTVGYSGTAPAPGYTKLAANAAGGVKTAADGQSYLVVDTDTSGKTVTIML